jgi:hypothetical protein
VKQVVCDSPPKQGSQEAEAEKADESATKKPCALTALTRPERAALRRRKISTKSEEAKKKRWLL